MNTFHIWPDELRRESGSIKVAAVLEFPGGDRERLWYSIPEERGANLPENCDPLVVGTVFLMMQAGVHVRVHGRVSPSLLRSLAEYQEVWVGWLPELKKVNIQADEEEETEARQPREEAILAFSGGVDSCFTAFRNRCNNAPRTSYRATAAIMVHGFDIPLDEPETFSSAIRRSERITSSLGLNLIPVATNYRELVQDWSHSFGPAVASCLALFSGRFKAGLIAQGLTYGELGLLLEGSNPLTDRMLSSDFFKVVPDGGAFDRAEKIWQMREWKDFLENLRVCWAGPQKDRNCCVCEKCFRNILTFRALGLGLPSCFEHDVTIRQIHKMRLGGKVLATMRYAELGELASAHGSDGEWSKTLQLRLAPYEWSQDHRLIRYLKHPVHYATRAWQLLKIGF